MSQVRVDNFPVSLDGFGTREGQSRDAAPPAYRSGHLRRSSSGVGGSTPALGRPGRASLMAQPFEDGAPGAVSRENGAPRAVTCHEYGAPVAVSHE